MKDLSATTHPAVLRYSQGEISTFEAATIMGGDTTVHDVVHQLRQARLPLLRHDRKPDQAALAKARKLFGPAR